MQQKRLRASGDSPTVGLAPFMEHASTSGLLLQLTFFAGMAPYFLTLAACLQKGWLLAPLHSGLVFGAFGLGSSSPLRRPASSPPGSARRPSLSAARLGSSAWACRYGPSAPSASTAISDVSFPV
ncbi:hypothetical protein [Streptomyces sp. NPDC059597]|uniref:hypothetical protein n=1 Tax=Streptomyces sp. NPDC059597 TaxID=3346879 RepID=UPI0036C73275